MSGNRQQLAAIGSNWLPLNPFWAPLATTVIILDQWAQLLGFRSLSIGLAKRRQQHSFKQSSS